MQCSPLFLAKVQIGVLNKNAALYFAHAAFKTELRIFTEELQHTSAAMLVCDYTYKERQYTDNKDLKLDISNMNPVISQFSHNISFIMF